jgi:hypothetical protein
MKIKVKYLSKEIIEQNADELLSAFFKERCQRLEAPIPVEDILEQHLGLSLDFDDLESIFGIPDVLGALWVDRREVFIDQSLDPEEHPYKEGCYNFSLGHEIGHWELHRHFLKTADSQIAMFTDTDIPPAVICRISQAKERIEWQADYFSSCLLMPRQLVLNAWRIRHGHLEPMFYSDVAEKHWARPPVKTGMRPIGVFLRNALNDEYKPHARAFDHVARNFAPDFRVSVEAMRIRLENIGLLQVGRSMGPDLVASNQ